VWQEWRMAHMASRPVAQRSILRQWLSRELDLHLESRRVVGSVLHEWPIHNRRWWAAVPLWNYPI